MGWVISFLKGLTDSIEKENKFKLYLVGLIITFIVVSLSGISGWLIERLFLLFEIENPIPVSYTHLTLPTIYSV